MDAKTGGPIKIPTVCGGWSALYDGLLTRCEVARAKKKEWEAENMKPRYKI